MEYHAFHADRDTVLLLSSLPLVSAFGQILLDPDRGLVLLMAKPNHLLAGLRQSVTTLITHAARRAGLDSLNVGRHRWRRPDMPAQTGLECLSAFYFGQNATDYRDARKSTRSIPLDFTMARPPDLALDIGATCIDKERLAILRELGFAEYWHIDIPQVGRFDGMTATLTALQCTGNPAGLTHSDLLPAVSPAALLAHLQKKFSSS